MKVKFFLEKWNLGMIRRGKGRRLTMEIIEIMDVFLPRRHGGHGDFLTIEEVFVLAYTRSYLINLN